MDDTDDIISSSSDSYENDSSDSSDDDSSSSHLEGIAQRVMQKWKSEQPLSGCTVDEPLFTIDTGKSTCSLKSSNGEDTSSNAQGNDSGNIQLQKVKQQQRGYKFSSSLKPGISTSNSYITPVTPSRKENKKRTGHSKTGNNRPGFSEETQKLLKKSIITDDFAKLHTVDNYTKRMTEKKRARKAIKDNTRNGMMAPEMTPELRHDLEVLSMRKTLSKDNFYKSADIKALPKYFQMGRIVENPMDFYSSRIPKKQRKQTMVDELLADEQFKKINKKRYAELKQQPYQQPFKRFKKKRNR